MQKYRGIRLFLCALEASVCLGRWGSFYNMVFDIFFFIYLFFKSTQWTSDFMTTFSLASLRAWSVQAQRHDQIESVPFIFHPTSTVNLPPWVRLLILSSTLMSRGIWGRTFSARGLICVSVVFFNYANTIIATCTTCQIWPCNNFFLMRMNF